MSRLFLVPLLACMVLSSPAAAAKFRISDGIPSYQTYAGDPNNLPVNCGVSPSELVARARTLHKVQAAVAEFERRGYTYANASAREGCTHPNLYSALALTYRRPHPFH